MKWHRPSSKRICSHGLGKSNYFYVLAGIANTKDQAAALADEITGQGLEVYVKEWTASAKEIQVQKHEKEWLQTYQTQWNSALDSVSKGSSLSAEGWQKVVDTIPKNPKNIADLTASVKEEYQQMGQADKWQDHMSLLRLWEQFNQLASD